VFSDTEAYSVTEAMEAIRALRVSRALQASRERMGVAGANGRRGSDSGRYGLDRECGYWPA
jgi:hypothetical protein